MLIKSNIFYAIDQTDQLTQSLSQPHLVASTQSVKIAAHWQFRALQVTTLF